MKKFVLIAGTINHHADTDEVRYVHLDASDRMLHDAEMDIFVQADVVANLSENLPMFRDSMFDEVVCSHVFEHIPGQHLPTVLYAIRRVLKSDGRLVVETPNMTGIAQAWVDQAYKEEELQQWIHGEDIGGAFDGHRYSFSPESLQRALELAKFSIAERADVGLAIRFVAVPR